MPQKGTFNFCEKDICHAWVHFETITKTCPYQNPLRKVDFILFSHVCVHNWLFFCKIKPIAKSCFHIHVCIISVFIKLLVPHQAHCEKLKLHTWIHNESFVNHSPTTTLEYYYYIHQHAGESIALNVDISGVEQIIFLSIGLLNFVMYFCSDVRLLWQIENKHKSKFKKRKIIRSILVCKGCLKLYLAPCL